eukprot:gene2338-4631_t
MVLLHNGVVVECGRRVGKAGATFDFDRTGYRSTETVDCSDLTDHECLAARVTMLERNRGIVSSDTDSMLDRLATLEAPDHRAIVSLVRV